MHVRDGAGGGRNLGLADRGAAEHLRLSRVGIAAVAQVHRCVPTDHGAHVIGGITMPRQTEQRRELAAGRFTPRNNAVDVNVQFFRVGAQPTHGSFRVVDLRREGRLTAQPIIDRDDGEASSGQARECRGRPRFEGPTETTAGANRPTATMEVHDCG